jgi:16S rRNA processing protein RimM
MAAPAWIDLGYVARPHGVRGSLLLLWHDGAAPLQPFAPKLRLSVPQGPVVVAEVRAHRPHKGGTLVDLVGIATLDEAQKFKGAAVAVPEDAVPQEAEGEVYLYRLMGARCVATDGTELGTLEHLYDHGSTVLLGLKPPDQGDELLVPLLDTTLRQRLPATDATPLTLVLELLPDFLAS